MLQTSVQKLQQVAPALIDDLDQDQLDQATALLDELRHPLSADDIEALIYLLPADGDTAHGLNWTILHAIEASPEWPIWRLLRDPDHEWIDLLKVRLHNGGYVEG